MNHCNPIGASYPSLRAFYNADVRRLRSRERDVGLMWRGEDGATYRAAWVQETGEVYLYKHGHEVDGGGTVDVLLRRFGLGELQAALRGYHEVCGRRGSLSWFLDRTRALESAAAAA
jgi:hypothetical protein